MLSFPTSTFPTFTIGTKVGLSMSTSMSSGLTRVRVSSCAHSDVGSRQANMIMRNDFI